MTNTVPTTATPPQDPICVACLGDRTDPPPTGQPCLRCKGTDADPDPLASTGIEAAS
jgi:hypothetical protein